MDYSDAWNPYFEEDFTFDFNINPIEFIKHKVFRQNESWDINVLGYRGGGKSTLGLSLMLMLNPKLLKMSPREALDRSWCFSIEERNKKKETLRRGDVCSLDEQGTALSGSSYQFRSKENQQYADNVQLARVDGVIELGITLDSMRVVKRVRDTYRVTVYPENKLTNDMNKDHGMAIDCIFREIRENPFARSDSDRFKPSYFKYGKGGRIARMTIPLPPTDYWNEYMQRRKEFKEKLDSVAPPREKGTKKTNMDKLNELIATNGGVSVPKKSKKSGTA